MRSDRIGGRPFTPPADERVRAPSYPGGVTVKPLGLAAAEDRAALLEERAPSPRRVGVPKLTVWATPSASSACSIVDENDAFRSFFVIDSASGGPAARRPAQSSTKASISAAGTTRLTMPNRSASAAEMMSAKNASSLALCSPTRRGSTHEPPKSMLRPRRAKISLKRASSRPR